MNQYQKIACLGFRLVGSTYFVYSVFWTIFGVLRFLSHTDSLEDNGSGVVFWTSIFNFSFSMVLFY